MTWLLIGKLVLLGFIAVGCSALVVTYVRRRRAGVRPMRDPQRLCLSGFVSRDRAADTTARVGRTFRRYCHW